MIDLYIEILKILNVPQLSNKDKATKIKTLVDKVIIDDYMKLVLEKAELTKSVKNCECGGTEID